METTCNIATEQDVPELVKLVNSAYRGDSSRQGWTTEADLLDGIRISEAALKKMVHDENTTILKLVNSEHDILGSVLIEKQNNKMYLGMLTVCPTLQNLGLGKKLMHEAEIYAKSHDCEKMEMTVISDRIELIDWYLRRGYMITGEKRPFPMGNPEFGMPKKHLQFEVLEKKL